MVAPIKRFFTKGGDQAKRFFTKDTGNAVKDAFRKTEAVVKQVKNEAPGVIDEALRKTSNSLKEAAPVIAKIGTGLQMASVPIAASGGPIGAAIGGVMAGAGTGLSKSEKAIKNLGGVVGDIRKETTLKRGSGIQAPKPVEEEPRDPLPFY